MTNLGGARKMYKKIVLCALCVIMGGVMSMSCGLFTQEWGVVRDFTVSEELALEIGRAVLKDVFGEKAFEGRELWVLDEERHFVVALHKPYALGGGFSVFINKKDGKIIKICMGE